MSYWERDCFNRGADCSMQPLSWGLPKLWPWATCTPSANGPAARWRICKTIANVMCKIASRTRERCFLRNCSSSMLNKIANRPYNPCADWLNHFHSLWESEGYKVESRDDQLRLTWKFIWASLGTVIIVEQETIKFRRTRASEASGRIYLQVAASWVRLRAQSPCTIFNDSLTGHRTPIWHKLRSLIDFGHATVGNPSSSWIMVAILWLGTRIAIFPRFAISLSLNRKFSIVWQALFLNWPQPFDKIRKRLSNLWPNALWIS